MISNTKNKSIIIRTPVTKEFDTITIHGGQRKLHLTKDEAILLYLDLHNLLFNR